MLSWIFHASRLSSWVCFICLKRFSKYGTRWDTVVNQTERNESIRYKSRWQGIWTGLRDYNLYIHALLLELCTLALKLVIINNVLYIRAILQYLIQTCFGFIFLHLVFACNKISRNILNQSDDQSHSRKGLMHFPALRVDFAFMLRVLRVLAGWLCFRFLW